VCHRSAEWSQEHIRPDCHFYVIYDVTGVTGFILGFSDLQPGCAAPRSAFQGPSGTFAWRFLQARRREEYIHAQYIWCMAKRINMTKLSLSLLLEFRGQAGEGKVCRIKRLLFGNYFKANWSYECIFVILKFQRDIITYSALMRIAGTDSNSELT
jgi:hypothetical protein